MLKKSQPKVNNIKLYPVLNNIAKSTISVSMDELNKPTDKIKIVKKLNDKTKVNMPSVYVSVMTNGYTKILRI